MTDKKSRIAVVGAGITGLTVSHLLRSAGHDVWNVDKGRGLGGRCAARRRDGAAFDHGAQYLSLSADREDAPANAVLRDLVGAGIEAGHVSEWAVPAADRQKCRYVGLPGMSGFARMIPGHDAAVTSCEIAQLQRLGQQWSLVDVGGTLHDGFDFVVVTAPSPQAHRLLAPHSDAFAPVAAVEMVPNWTGMFAFASPLEATSDVIRHASDTLGWVVCEGAKPGREHLPHCWTVQASDAWSRDNLEREKADVARDLLAAFAELYAVSGPLPTVTYIDAHRWRYARAETPLGRGSIFDPSVGLAVAGDWCLGARINDAVASALDVVEAMTGRIGANA